MGQFGLGKFNILYDNRLTVATMGYTFPLFIHWNVHSKVKPYKKNGDFTSKSL